ncbi:MAG TPA: YceI family protein [Saprospiraceae bacterium]|nr:YceI family protein [Saprospiraceae bacterium]
MKTMSIYLLTLVAALVMPLFVSATGNDGSNDRYVADVTASEIIWKAYKVTGQHEGTVELKSGTLIFEDNVLAGGEFSIDMTTIKNNDMAGSGGAAKLEGHLKSDDFFSVANHPTASFKITKVIPYGTAGDYRVAGDLTIKGITKPIKFMAHVANTNGILTATADITIDRSEFDVRYGSGSFFDDLGDKALHDDFDLVVQLTLNPA